MEGDGKEGEGESMPSHLFRLTMHGVDMGSPIGPVLRIFFNRVTILPHFEHLL